MYSLRKTMVYFLIFTVIGSFVAYSLVIKSYEAYDYTHLEVQASSDV